MDKGVPTVVHAVSTDPADIFRVSAAGPLTPGRHKVRFYFASDPGFLAGGLMRIEVGGQPVGEVRIRRTIARVARLVETFDIGRDTGAPVTEYRELTLPRTVISKVDVTLR